MNEISEQDEQSYFDLLISEYGHIYGYVLRDGDSYVASSLDGRARALPTTFALFKGVTFWPSWTGQELVIKRPNDGSRIPLDVLPVWMRMALKRLEGARWN